MNRLNIVTFALCAACLGVHPAFAQLTDPSGTLEASAPPDKPQSDESLVISPYLWGPDISGTVSLGAIAAPVDLSLGQLASGVKIGGMGHVQYQRGPVFAYAEAIGAKFGDPQFDSFFNQPVRARAILAETGMGVSTNIMLENGSRLHLSPYAGLRYVEINAAVSGPLIAVSGHNSWVDPVVGVIADYEISDKWNLMGKFDFAGLSVTDNSYRSFQLGLSHSIGSRLSIVAGYRSSKGNFRASQGLSADLGGQGPVIGLRYVITGNTQ